MSARLPACLLTRHTHGAGGAGACRVGRRGCSPGSETAGGTTAAVAVARPLLAPGWRPRRAPGTAAANVAGEDAHAWLGANDLRQRCSVPHHAV